MPCVITLVEWLSRCEGCGWGGVRSLQRVPVSLDNWCLLCFRGICAAPVDRAAPHLLPNISCLLCFFHWSHRPPLTDSPHRFMRKTPLSVSHFPQLPESSSSACLGLMCYLDHPLTWTLLSLPPYTQSSEATGRLTNTQAVYYAFPLCSNQTLRSYLKGAAGSLHSLLRARQNQIVIDWIHTLSIVGNLLYSWNQSIYLWDEHLLCISTHTGSWSVDNMKQ